MGLREGKNPMEDVVIIGAGPAGSTVAGIIAKSGFDVRLMEKRKPLETKVCGGDISMALAKELSLGGDVVEKVVSHEVLHFPWGVKVRPFRHVTVLRETFDKFLADRARKLGARVCYENKVIGVTRKGELMYVHIKDLKDVENFSMRCKLVVFADGPLTLATKLFPNVGFKGTISNLALAARYELEWKNNGMNHHELFYGPDISSWGYGWIFPTKNSLNVGVGCLLSALRESRAKITEMLRRFIRHRKIGREELETKKILGFGAALVPLAPADRIFGPSCLVVGDAAGMVDPLAGCGIESAVHAGKLAGNIAVEALQRENFSEEFLSRYQVLWKQSLNYSVVKRSYRIAKVAIPLSRVDKNLLSKIGYVLHFGKRSLIDVHVMLYPLTS